MLITGSATIVALGSGVGAADEEAADAERDGVGSAVAVRPIGGVPGSFGLLDNPNATTPRTAAARTPTAAVRTVRRRSLGLEAPGAPDVAIPLDVIDAIGSAGASTSGAVAGKYGSVAPSARSAAVGPGGAGAGGSTLPGAPSNVAWLRRLGSDGGAPGAFAAPPTAMRSSSRIGVSIDSSTAVPAGKSATIASRISFALWNRVATSMSSARFTTAATLSGIHGAWLRTGGAGSEQIASKRSPSVSAVWCGVTPVSTWNSTTPADQTSARASRFFAPLACSGDMYIGEPMSELVCVSATSCALASGSAFTFAMPKSQILTTISPAALCARKTFAGLMSRWMTPASCARSRPSSSCAMMRSPTSHRTTPRRFSIVSRSSPESSSITR